MIRHCAADGQAGDAPLSAAGRAQAEALAASLADAGIDRIVASPYRRAIDSIAPLARRLGLAVERDDRLTERVLSTHLLPDWRERLRASFNDPDLVLEGGESSRMAMARGVESVEDALRGAARTPAIVTHGNLLTLMLRRFDARYGFEAWQAMTNADIYRLFPTLQGCDIARFLAE